MDEKAFKSKMTRVTYIAGAALILTVAGTTYFLSRGINKLGESIDNSFNELNESIKNYDITANKELNKLEKNLGDRFDTWTENMENKADRAEFPHIENFTVLASNLGIPRSELRSLQRYFDAYNKQIKEQIKHSYPTNV
ncbi:hypothetical protein ACFLZJ_01205 [Nanoarchaeota archaeon]